MNWQPIETAPKDVWVLIYVGDRVDFAVRDAAGWFIDGEGYLSDLNELPTHWMPLPDPPKEEK